MLPIEPKTCTNVRKLKPDAKLPVPAILRDLSAAQAKLLKRLLSDPAEYVWDEALDYDGIERFLLCPLSQCPVRDGGRTADDSGIFGLDALPMRAMDRERFLFLRMNFCRRRVYHLLREHAGRRLTNESLAELFRWEALAAEARGEIVRDNVPLVLAMAKRTRIVGVDLTDLISEGNLALLRAVNKFDTSRGYRFSTYACRAILKSFSRVATRTSRYRGHFPTEFDPQLEKSNFVEQLRTTAESDCVLELKAILRDNAAELSEVEHKVILARFAIEQENDPAADKAKTLEQVGEMIGVTKERVRQIQNKALGKLRNALEQVALAR